MTECRKCGHIGQPKTVKRWDKFQLTFLLLLMFPLWFILAFIVLSIGVLGNFCHVDFIISTGCFNGTIIISTILTIIYIIAVLYKSKQMIEICEECNERIEEEKVGRDKDLFS